MENQNFDVKSKTISMENYKVLRAYIDEENKLLNYRMTWLLTINGFLFASYAIVLQKKIDKGLNNKNFYSMIFDLNTLFNSIERIPIFLMVICILGLFICDYAKSGIRGARRAVSYLEKFVENHFENYIVECSSDSYPEVRFPKKVYKLDGNNEMERNLFKFKANELREKGRIYIFCIEVMGNGLMPFITGGGFHEPSRSTKMASLGFVKFLTIAWMFLLLFSISI